MSLAALVKARVVRASIAPAPEPSQQTLSPGEHAQKSSHNLCGGKSQYLVQTMSLSLR